MKTRKKGEGRSKEVEIRELDRQTVESYPPIKQIKKLKTSEKNETKSHRFSIKITRTRNKTKGKKANIFFDFSHSILPEFVTPLVLVIVFPSLF